MRVRQTVRMAARRVLAVDVGGSHVKFLATGETERRRFASGPKLQPGPMVEQILSGAADWRFHAAPISVGPASTR